MRRRAVLEPACVLHSRPWRETSLLVEAMTREHGRIGLVARGARRPRSRLRGLLLPFRQLLLSWSGRGELPSLTGAEADESPPVLLGESLFSAFYLNELLMKLIPRFDAYPIVFDEYRDALGRLGAGDQTGCVLRVFEKRLLDALGYGPTLDYAVDTGAPLSAQKRYRYVPERGPVSCSNGPETASGPIVSGKTLMDLSRGRLDGERERIEARGLMRALLAPHLGTRTLGSRQLFARTVPAEPAAETPK